MDNPIVQPPLQDLPITPAPLIIELGEHSSKRIRKLRQGRGKLMDELQGLLAELQQAGTVSPMAQLVVVVVQERPELEFGKWQDCG